MTKATGNIVEKVTLETLTGSEVGIVKQRHYVEGTQSLPLGEPHRRAFVNSPSDRENLKNYDIPKNYIQAVLDVWGKNSTVEDPKIEELPTE